MIGLHESTLALSVYNALARCGNLSRDQLFTLLTKNWESGMERSELDSGVDYLKCRNMVAEEDGVLAPVKLVNGAAATVIRHPSDKTALVYSPVQQKVKVGTQLDSR